MAAISNYNGDNIATWYYSVDNGKYDDLKDYSVDNGSSGGQQQTWYYNEEQGNFKPGYTTYNDTNPIPISYDEEFADLKKKIDDQAEKIDILINVLTAKSSGLAMINRRRLKNVLQKFDNPDKEEKKEHFGSKEFEI